MNGMNTTAARKAITGVMKGRALLFRLFFVFFMGVSVFRVGGRFTPLPPCPKFTLPPFPSVASQPISELRQVWLRRF